METKKRLERDISTAAVLIILIVAIVISLGGTWTVLNYAESLSMKQSITGSVNQDAPIQSTGSSKLYLEYTGGG